MEELMRRLAIVFWLALLIFPAESHGQKYAGEFMALGGGARAMGMGGAFIAVANDATATFWNPAGLADFSSFEAEPGGWEAVLMHAEQFGDLINSNFLSVAFPIKGGESGWGLSIMHMGIPDIPIVFLEAGMITNSDGDNVYEPQQGEGLNFDPDNLKYESANDIAALFSYAQRFSFALAGANVKIIRNDQVTGVSSLGIGVDIGLLRRRAWKDLAVGVKMQDATGTCISWSTGEREFIYPTLKIGCAYPFSIQRMSSTLLLAVDGDFRYENRRGAAQFWIGRASADFHVGAEVLIRDIVALRGGLDMGRPTAGMGIMLQSFGPWHTSLGLDYAFLHHDEFDMTHRISLLVAL
jgi:hypothetical protein